MLGKLIKYDLKYIYKQLFVFYLIVLSCAIVARLTNFETNSFIIIFIHEFAQGCAYGFSFGMFVNATMRTWARFHQNFYKDESYLTHTLPIPRPTLWSAKFLSSLIVVLISGLTLIAALLIMTPFNELIHGWSLNNPDALRFYLTMFVATFFQIAYIVQCGFTGILIGHRNNNNRAVHSVIWGLVTYFAGIIILAALVLLWSLFDGYIHDLIFSGTVGEINQFNKLIIGFGIIYCGLDIATYFINAKLLSRGVNVD